MYTTLEQLKTTVLPNSIRGDKRWDGVLQRIGEGVAAQFDRYCNRTFRRSSAAVVEFSGQHECYVLPHYPLESVSTVETRTDPAAAWLAVTDAIDMQSNASGLIHFCNSIATECERIRITYSGGYFVDLTGDTALPAGATALPADVLMAWEYQCEWLYSKLDHTGSKLLDGLGGAAADVLKIGLTSPVREVLDMHKRYQIL